MELQAFISKALSEIASGIAQGRERAAEHGVIIGQPLYGENVNAVSTSKCSCPAIPEFVSFDVAVTVSSEGGAQAGIRVWGLSLGELTSSPA